MPRSFLSRSLSILVILSLPLTSCDSAGDSGEDQDVLVPLKSGNTWTAVGEAEDGPDGLNGDSLSVRVTDSGNIEVLESSLSVVGNPGDRILVNQTSDGLLIGSNLEFGVDNFLLEYPVESGDKYEYTDAAGNRTFEVTITEERIEVPAGTFDTIVYTIKEISFDRIVGRVYIEPGFGPVRWNILPDDPAFFADYMLVEAKLDDG